jgi:hypothetical protein
METPHSTRRHARIGGLTSTSTLAAGPQPVLALEEHFTPAELAQLWGFSPNFIRNTFKDETGVIVIDRPEEMNKRGYSTIRIPRSVAERVHRELRAA